MWKILILFRKVDIQYLNNMEEKIKIALEWWEPLDASVKKYLVNKYFWIEFDILSDNTIMMIYEAEQRSDLKL